MDRGRMVATAGIGVGLLYLAWLLFNRPASVDEPNAEDFFGPTPDRDQIMSGLYNPGILSGITAPAGVQTAEDENFSLPAFTRNPLIANNPNGADLYDNPVIRAITAGLPDKEKSCGCTAAAQPYTIPTFTPPVWTPPPPPVAPTLALPNFQPSPSRGGFVLNTTPNIRQGMPYGLQNARVIF